MVQSCVQRLTWGAAHGQEHAEQQELREETVESHDGCILCVWVCVCVCVCCHCAGSSGETGGGRGRPGGSQANIPPQKTCLFPRRNAVNLPPLSQRRSVPLPNQTLARVGLECLSATADLYSTFPPSEFSILRNSDHTAHVHTDEAFECIQTWTVLFHVKTSVGIKNCGDHCWDIHCISVTGIWNH